MKKSEKLDYLASFEKEENIHDLLEELLPELGYGDVTITHERGNAPENGKDLLCSQYDEIEDKKDWTAFVVKKGVISGTSVKINEIEAQATDCFKYSYKSLAKGKHINISKVKVVTNLRFTNAAEKKILDNKYFDKANIDFWDGNKIVGFIDKYYKNFWIKGSKEYKKYIEKLFEFINTDNISKSIGIKNLKIKNLIDEAVNLNLYEIIKDNDGSFHRKQYSSTSILKIPDNSIIIGQPGSGKTTLFKILAKEIIEQNSIRNHTEFYPIIITFKNLYEEKFNVVDAIRAHLSSDIFKEINIDFDSLLKKQNFVLFVDSLDEVGKIELKEEALNCITEFKSKNPNIKIFCSSRPSDYLIENCQSLGFCYLEIDELDRRQIEQFINTYFSEDFIKCKKLLKSLKDSGILGKLPKTPLTLALISIIFDEREIEIPATISDLYGIFVELLLGKSTITTTTEVIDFNIKKHILSSLAKELHVSYKQSISYKDAVVFVDNYCNERGIKSKRSLIVEDLINNTGLLYKNAKNEIQFKHLSFQEYFAAVEFFNHRPGERNIFIANFNKIWWQNVAIFYAGLSKDSPKLIESILEKSIPQSFEEAVINIGGIGHLLQALYNTPKGYRVKGLSRSTKSTLFALESLINSEDKKYELFRHFSKYSLMMILSNWFLHTHSSITLVEPIKMFFNKEIESNKEHQSEEEKFNRDFSLFLLAATIGNSQFLDFEPLLKLFQDRKSNDLSLTAVIDTHIKEEEKLLIKTEKNKTIFKKLKSKNAKYIGQLKGIADLVNKPLKKK